MVDGEEAVNPDCRKKLQAERERFKNFRLQVIPLTTTLKVSNDGRTTESQASISPVPPDAIFQTSSSVRCPECSLIFAGSPQEAESNFRRHLRTSPTHNNKGRLKCPLPECRRSPPKRSDNFEPHLMNFHGILSAPERQIIMRDVMDIVDSVQNNQLSTMLEVSNGRA